MKKSALFPLLVSFAALASPLMALVVDFDTASNWTKGSDVTYLHHYSSLHTYSEANWLFAGGEALRQGTSSIDGVPGALGAYSWRLRNNSSVVWTATFSGTAEFSKLGFDVRRWDVDPLAYFGVEFSLDGGSSFTSAGSIDNTFFDNSSNWKAFQFDVSGASSTSSSSGDDVIVKVAALRGTSQIMIDNFTSVPASVPESGTTLTFLGLAAFGLILFRRFQT